MGLTGRQSLDVVEIVYYTLAIPLIAIVIRKDEITSQLGWVYLAMFAVARIVGAATGIASVNNPSTLLVEISSICTSVGIAPLLLCLLLGILSRVNEDMSHQGFARRDEQAIHFLLLIGLFFGVWAGIKEFSSNSSTQGHGHSIMKAVVILFLMLLIALAALTLQIFTRRQYHRDTGMRIRWLVVCVLSLPFLLVRVVFSIISAFNENSKTFSTVSDTTSAIVVQSIMLALMEFIVVALFVSAGLTNWEIPRETINTDYSELGDQSGVAGNEVPQSEPPISAARTSGETLVA